MRRSAQPFAAQMPAASSASFIEHHRRRLAALTLASFLLTSVGPVLAGGYVDGNVVLNPAKAINTGGVSLTPTFNNDQFNDQLLVGTVNNDAIRTPSTVDPVSTVSGNNYHDETDFVIRGRNGLNTVFTRTYNSAPSATTVDRGLGYGWTHSYLMRLKSNDFGDCPNCTSAQKPENANSKTSSITYTDERGGEQAFLVNESSYAITPPKGVYDTLTLDSPSTGQHTLTFRNGVKYIFETPTGTLKTTPNVVARLKYIDNAWGDRLTLAYDGNGRLSTLTDNLSIAGRTGITFTYHPDGRLKDVSDWTARKWSYTYDTAGNLLTTSNPLAQVLTYGYDVPKHRLTSIAKPLQRDGQTVQTAFKYYENGRTFQQTNSFGQGDTLDYDLYRKSTRVTDPRGGVREYFYDDNGRMTKLVEPDGAVLLFENQGDAIRSKKYDALGYTTTYSYRADKVFTGTSDVFGNVTRELDALNRTVDTTYGPLDQVASVKDKRGTTATTTYGASTSGCDYTNRPKETRLSALSGSANVLLSSQCWNSNGTLNTSRSYLDGSRYRETRLTYEAGSNGLNVSQQQIVGMPSGITATQTFTYDSLGRKKTETLKRRASPTNAGLIDLTTAYDYDALDRVTKMTDSLGNEAINHFDANGQLWKVTHRYKKSDGSFDVRDVVTRSFDAADRVKTETDAEGGVTSYAYDEAGNVIAVTDAEGHTSHFEYDAMNRRTTVIDATGYRTTTALTLRGDVVGLTNANSETVSFEVDALGRKTAVIDAKGYRSEFQYDENGNLTCSIDANAQAGLQAKNTFNCSEYRTYDELNRVTKIVDALNGETSFTYDFAGNRLIVKDAENKTWSFTYDDLGRLVSETDHSAKTIAYKPDEAGNIFEKTNRLNEISRFTYDNGNRLTRIDYLKDGTAETFGYDAAGNRNAAANAGVSYGFTWDRLNRLIGKLDSRGKSLSFSFDKVGNILTKTTYQNSTTSYVYNASNRLVMLRNPDYTQVDYQYDPAGRLLSRVTAAGARSSYQYDANGGLSKLSQYDAANALISDTTYTRDRVGNVLTQADASGTTTYTMDALYRLKTADYPGTANDEAFDYDKVGNRKLYTKGSLAPNANTRYYNYTANTNRLAEIRIGSTGGTLESAFTNDFEGRLTSQTGIGAKTLTWDAKGRVKTVGGESYQYDPMDYRIGRSGGSLGNLSYYLEGEHLESVEDSGGLKERYFRGATTDELVAAYLKDTDGKTKPFLFHHDALTSTTAVSGHNGGTIQNVTYSAFGQVQSSTGSSPNRLKFTGREDDQSGLYYYRARFYDPVIGRFVSEDPKGFGAGMNFYAYVENSPVNANDPSGLDLVTGMAKLGGRLGSKETREHVVQVAQEWMAKGWNLVSGGGGKETLIKNPVTNSSKGGAYGDIVLENPVTGQRKIINTVDTYADGITPTAREAAAGVKIQNLRPDAEFTMIPKPKAGQAAAAAAAGLGAGSAQASDGGIFGTGVTWGELGDFMLDMIVPGGVGGTGGCSGGTCSDMINWNTIGPTSSYAPAGGGFLLYPNKANTNMMQSVYSK